MKRSPSGSAAASTPMSPKRSEALSSTCIGNGYGAEGLCIGGRPTVLRRWVRSAPCDGVVSSVLRPAVTERLQNAGPAARLSALPTFHRPPVVEVVIGAKVSGAERYSLRSLGRFAAELASEGLVVEESQPGYEAPVERFDDGVAAAAPSVEFLFRTGHPPVRHLMRSAAGDEMVQLQPDWLGVNWRKADPDAVYPRWPARWETFERRASLAERCFAASSLRYDQVEVVYVNHIEQGDVWESHGQASRVFSFLQAAESFTDGFLTRPERAQVDLTFLMQRESAAEPVGRLHVTAAPGWSKVGMHPIFVMTLAARGKPESPTIDGVQNFADLARRWIVRAFADLTTSTMHEVWGRHDKTTGDTHA